MGDYRHLYIEYAQLEMRQAEIDSELMRLKLERRSIEERKEYIMDIVGMVAVEASRDMLRSDEASQGQNRTPETRSQAR